MEASTTIRRIFQGNKIRVPTYQRAYSWETPRKEAISINTQTDVFLDDLVKYLGSGVKVPFYFGHFLFEEKEDYLFHVIDGQQRLTTIVIFLSALFSKLKSLRNLSDDEIECFENIVKYRHKVHFSTVDFDNQLFIDYVINRTQKDIIEIETESAKRIVSAFDYFAKHFIDKDEQYLTRMLDIISKASCTTHIVKDESEAVLMFIFQNNRGKKPSNLEVIKAEFMYKVHLHGGEEREATLEEVKNRFEKIYRAISSIDYNIDEDDVLIYTMRVYFNRLWESGAQVRIKQILSEENSVSFVKEFSQSLATTFEILKKFFCTDERNSYSIHSLVTLGGISVAFPFIIKAYQFGLDIKTIENLCAALESLVLRHRLIGTRADITTRLNDVFQGFTETNKSIQPIIDCVNKIKRTSDGWWAYWNNSELEKAIQDKLESSVAKFLLWKYENFLKSQKKHGDSYSPTRYDDIESPELEHIAPKNEPKEKPTGYDKYDVEFYLHYLDCLGNYLLISKPHNRAVGNIPFSEKRKTYTFLAQQDEIRDLVPENGTWDKSVIQKRKEKIVKFIMDTF